MRPGSAKDVVGLDSARMRRGAPGRRFVGDRAAQAREARQQELERVHQMVEDDRREKRDEASIPGILADLVVDSLRLARAIVAAPFRILEAVRRGNRVEA